MFGRLKECTETVLGDQTICNVDFDHEEASHDACAGLISSSLQGDAGFDSGFSSGFEHWLHGLAAQPLLSLSGLDNSAWLRGWLHRRARNAHTLGTKEANDLVN